MGGDHLGPQKFPKISKTIWIVRKLFTLLDMFPKDKIKSSYIQKTTQNLINALRIYIHNRKIPRIQKYIYKNPDFSKSIGKYQTFQKQTIIYQISIIYI